MALLRPALKMAKFPPHVEGKSVDLFWDEPDPFIEGVQVVPCPKAEPQARHRGPVFQLNAEGARVSTGIIWPGAPYADGARPTTAENPLRPASAPPPFRGNCARPVPDGLGPLPDGPAVALSPRSDAGTGPVAGKPWTGPPAEKRSSGDSLGPIQPPLVSAASPPIQPPLILGPSPRQRARSTGPPPFPCSREARDLEARDMNHALLLAQQAPPEARDRNHAWLLAQQPPPVKCARPPQNEQASSSSVETTALEAAYRRWLHRQAPPPCATPQQEAPPPLPQGPRPLAPPVPARAPRDEPLPSGELLPSGDPLPASPQATRKNCGGFAWQPKDDNGVRLVELATSSSSASPPRRPRSQNRAKAPKTESTKLPPVYETKEVPEWRMPSRTNPPGLGMHPTAEYLAWRMQNFGPELDAQVQSATHWAPDAEYSPPEWEPVWTSTPEWESGWESWAADAEYSPPEREPVWPSTQEQDWNPEWGVGWQPAAGPPTAAALPDEAYELWPDFDRRTPNHTPDGRRTKRPRGGGRERSHNGYYRPAPRN